RRRRPCPCGPWPAGRCGPPKKDFRQGHEGHKERPKQTSTASPATSLSFLSSCSSCPSWMASHAAAYFCRSLSRKRLLSAVTSQAFGQKHRSTAHQSCGTPQLSSSGTSLSKFSLPVPNGLCVLVLCSLSVPSLSIRWMCVILPFNFWSSSISPPGS